MHLWYVHNLPESKNVKAEMDTAALTATAALESHFKDCGVDVAAREVGRETLEEWYQALSTPILITDKLVVNVKGGIELSEGDWRTLVTAVPGEWLYSIYKTYQAKLFSANVRGYLGAIRSDANINNGIKTTAQTDPQHFYVYNNGLTAIVNDYEFDEASRQLTITGLSIVNGAQTTGAIGNLKNAPAGSLWVPARFVRCDNGDTVRGIIQYNNSQNKVEAADFRSNDPVQRRLREEFERIPNVTYSGGRRGGHEDIIRRPGNLLPSDTAAQALAALHQDPIVAYHQKSEIWASNSLYSRYFSERTKASHIVFAYSLLRAVEDKKLELTRPGLALTEAQLAQAAFLRNRGATFILSAAVAKCLETILGSKVPDVFALSFGNGVSPEDAKAVWRPIVEASAPFVSQLLPAVNGGMKSQDEVTKAVADFRNMVEATKGVLAPTYEAFRQRVVTA